MTWAIELSQYDLRYEPRHAIKTQAMADFLVEVTGDPTEESSIRWRLHIDGASNQTSRGAGIILKSPVGVVYEQSIKFEFPMSNNQAEYENLLGGLILAKEVRATRDALLQKYQERVKELSKQFKEVTIQHVLREKNTREDLLSKLTSTKPGAGNQSLIQGMIKEPAVTLHLTKIDLTWMDPIANFLENGKLSDDEKMARALRREAAKYVIIQGQLFKKGLSQPLLKCLHPEKTDYVLRVVHEGCYSHHIGGKALARKLIRAGYYWPSMMRDSQEFVRKYVKCQENANFHKALATELMITRFAIPEVVISDNGTQFTDKKFVEFLAGLSIKQKFSSVEHPQTNGQVEAANKVILLGLKKWLEKKKGAWANELASVLWSYCTTVQSSTGETPVRLTYGVDAMIPVEVGEPSPQLLLGGVEEVVQ
ncbi:uncharacterized protein [Arachis hypogaea]|uniref:uncharacterized protein n=1 Tax=Arachis hypogaea TaxID=3818 RepID=UPI0010FC5880|nr:uncharacterized protein LOC112772936 [Arachis hypogaea]